MYKVSLEGGLSCPNRIDSDGCIFCNMDTYRPKTSMQEFGVRNSESGKSIKIQLSEGIAYIRGRHHAGKVISYFQSGSNTNAKASILQPMFEEAIDHPDVVGLAISTRPDCIYEEHIELLSDLTKKTFLWIELGLQSSHNSTLEFIKRRHTVERFIEANSGLKRREIPVCAHVILGLPGESLDMILETARFLNEQKVWGVKIHNLHVLKDTKLEGIYERGECIIPSLEEYAARVVSFLEILNPDITIHRLNGHSPRNLTVAPDWSINKLAILNEVEKQLEENDTWQGKRYAM